MEAISAISSPAEIKQHNSIAVKQSSLEVCKNRKDMPFKDLLSSITKKLMSYAMMLTSNNEDDAWDLIQSTIEKLIKNKETLQASNQPVAYAKRILKNNFIDNYRKEKRMVSIEANDIAISNKGFQEASVEYQELLKCLGTFDETWSPGPWTIESTHTVYIADVGEEVGEAVGGFMAIMGSFGVLCCGGFFLLLGGIFALTLKEGGDTVVVVQGGAQQPMMAATGMAAPQYEQPVQYQQPPQGGM